MKLPPARPKPRKERTMTLDQKVEATLYENLYPHIGNELTARAAAQEVMRALSTASSGQAPLEGVHSDDLAVDKFAEAMKAKLKWEREVRERGGWDDPAKCSVEYLARLLIEHLGK